MSLLKNIETLSVVIDKKSQLEMVLQTPLDSSKNFFLNYNMNKMELSLRKLLDVLQEIESIIKQQASSAILIVDKLSTSTSKS